MADSSGQGGDGQYSGQQTLGQPGALPGSSDTSAAVSGCCSGAGSGSPASLPLFDDARTVEAWVKTTSTTTNQVVASWGTSNTDQAFVVELSPGSIAVDAYGDYHSISTPRPINDGGWHMVTVTYDGSVVAAYLDGQAIGSTQFNDALNTSSGPISIGGSTFTGSNWSGQLEEVAVYPQALSPARVAAHFIASGYSQPTAPAAVHASYGGSNAAQVTWGYSTASNTPVLGYLVTVTNGPNVGESLSTRETGALLTGLPAGSTSFQVRAFDAFGLGPASATAAFTVPGSATTYASAVLADAPAVFYRLGDSVAGLMADSSGNGTGGVYNAANVKFGVSPGAIGGDPGTGISDLGNRGGYGSVFSTGSIPLFNSPRSVELWLQQPATTNTGQALVSWGQPGSENAFAVIEASPTRLEVSGYADDHYFALPYPIDDGAWHQLVVSYDGSTILVYLDGVQVGSGHFNNPLDTLGGEFVLGSQKLGGGDLSATSLDDVSVFASALSSARVAAHFAASGHSRPTPPGSPAATAGANQATVTWTVSSAGSDSIAGYLVTALKSGVKQNAVAVAASAHTAVIGGLQGAASYTFTIQGIDAYGAGPAATTTAVTPTGSATTYASAVLADAPAVFYRLGDSVAGLMADSSGHSANGVYRAGVTFGASGPITGDPETAVSASGQEIGLANPASLPLFNQPRTVEGWVKHTDGGEYAIAGWGKQNGARAFEVSTAGRDVYARAWSDDLTFTTTTNLADGNWHFIAVTSNGTSATAYVDGVSLGTQTFPTPLDTVSSHELDIGSFQGAANFNGTLADVAIFPSMLSAAQIQAHYSLRPAIKRRVTIATDGRPARAAPPSTTDAHRTATRRSPRRRHSKKARQQ
jgi:hypothetical protein